ACSSSRGPPAARTASAPARTAPLATSNQSGRSRGASRRSHGLSPACPEWCTPDNPPPAFRPKLPPGSPAATAPRSWTGRSEARRLLPAFFFVLFAVLRPRDTGDTAAIIGSTFAVLRRGPPTQPARSYRAAAARLGRPGIGPSRAGAGAA